METPEGGGVALVPNPIGDDESIQEKILNEHWKSGLVFPPLSIIVFEDKLEIPEDMEVTCNDLIDPLVMSNKIRNFGTYVASSESEEVDLTN